MLPARLLGASRLEAAAGVRDTVTEELVREGSWAWFFVPVRWGWRRTWWATHSQAVRHRWAGAQPSGSPGRRRPEVPGGPEVSSACQGSLWAPHLDC